MRSPCISLLQTLSSLYHLPSTVYRLPSPSIPFHPLPFPSTPFHSLPFQVDRCFNGIAGSGAAAVASVKV